jgi:hypothetical protein
MEAIGLPGYSDDSFDRESVGHGKANSRQQADFSSSSKGFL